MTASKGFEIKDLGIGRLRKQLEQLRNEKITIGHQGASGAARHPDAEASVGQVAAWQEFGTPGSDDRRYGVPRSRIPSRPFVRTALTRGKGEAEKAVRQGISDLIDERATLEQVQERIGAAQLEGLRKVLDDSRSWAEPLADSTVAAKGHDQPLLDSGTLRDKASWAVRSGDKIKRQGGEE